ncbi:thioredoxin family protein [Aquimarina sp. ERC-38]|uniref:thioredoxin family protein n=1 Tax=Aquimarina sp. ERC-38 TaxID=2949996 RepID=UPI002245419B|nr:thioredoxin family protein [Aquimarina sp. ERC-38]UZO82580.1 thioredoxin family protein [Aquimarina sp. ERC-38]
MKNIILIIISGMLWISCGTSGKVSTTTPESVPEVSDSKLAKKEADVLIGVQTREAFTVAPYSNWFTSNYTNYKPKSDVITQLTPLLKNTQIKAFMGTWCSDSQRETPTFYKILDATDYDSDNLELVTVTRNKDTPEGLEKGLQIERVPTFIFYKNGKEVGRYVEYARKSLEEDMLAILSGEPYKHSYED